MGSFLYGLKQIRTICFAFIFSLFSVNLFASGITATATSASCTNSTLETYSGTSNLQANWQANPIDLYWYSDDTQITNVQSAATTCNYDSSLSVPSSAPTKTGYTFNGWKIRGLPDGYTRLQYLESTGSQYIDTGFYPDTAGYKHTIVFDVLSSGTGYLCGTSSTNGRSGNVKISNYKIIGIYNGTSSAINILSGNPSLLTTKNILVMDLHNNAVCPMSLNTNSINNQSTATVNSGTNLRIFTSVGSSIPLRIYYDSISKNGVLVHSFIPAKNSSNVLGMFDTVTQTFFTNAGSGTFTAGPVVQ